MRQSSPFLQVQLQASVAYGLVVTGRDNRFGTFRIDITAAQVCTWRTEPVQPIYCKLFDFLKACHDVGKD